MRPPRLLDGRLVRSRRALRRALRPGRDLPVLLKLLLPFVVLLVAVGSIGTYVIVNDLSAQAQTQLDQDAGRRALDARSLLHDRELYLLESASFAANLQGMADAARGGDAVATTRLLQSVVALKTDLDVAEVTRLDGTVVSGFARRADGRVGVGVSDPSVGTTLVAAALRTGTAVSDFAGRPPASVLAVATPVCSAAPDCRPVGVAVVGLRAARVAASLVGAGGATADQEGVAVHAADGTLVASAGTPQPQGALPGGLASGAVRRDETTPRGATVSLYQPFTLDGRPAGTVAVSIPTESALAGVHGAAVRLVLVLLLVIAGVVGVGALVSRLILRQVRALVVTNRALGSGDLSARAPVLGGDELGELAAGVNQMAEQLQASHATLEARVEERTEEVRRLMRDRSELFAGLSHDLRTPLVVIRNQAEMLLDPTYADDRGRAVDVGRVVADCSTELLSFVADILELARAESAPIDLERVDLDLGEFLRDMSRTWEALAATAQVTLSVTVPPSGPRVVADPRRLRQVLANLVDNAAKYTPAQGTVGVVARDEPTGTVVEVWDTGPGIPPGSLGRVFDPFYRVPGTVPQRGQASSGLGLAIARRLVGAQGGTVEVEPREGGGSVFRVVLPRPPSPDADAVGDPPAGGLVDTPAAPSSTVGATG